MAEVELSEPITLRLPKDVLEDIEKIAKLSQKSRSWVMVRALRLFIANEGAEILSVARGREQIARGECEDIDDVIADLMRQDSDGDAP